MKPIFGYCPNCGEDEEPFICDVCGEQYCYDCITGEEFTYGICKNCLERMKREEIIKKVGQYGNKFMA